MVNRPTVDKPENPMAFPGNKWTPDNQDVSEGMYLRDYFAGQALQGRIANGSKLADREEYAGKTIAEALAEECYFVADAMLKARSK